VQPRHGGLIIRELVLLDHNIPRGLANAISGHTVVEARARGWHELRNGELLTAAEGGGFDLLVTCDQNIRYQQNLRSRKIALIVLSVGRWRPVQQRLDAIALAVDSAAPGTYTEVEIPV
jgi:hypothetical protein